MSLKEKMTVLCCCCKPSFLLRLVHGIKLFVQKRTLISFTFLARRLYQESLLILIYWILPRLQSARYRSRRSSSEFYGTYRAAQTPAVLLVDLQLPVLAFLKVTQMICIRGQFCLCYRNMYYVFNLLCFQYIFKDI